MYRKVIMATTNTTAQDVVIQSGLNATAYENISIERVTGYNAAGRLVPVPCATYSSLNYAINVLLQNNFSEVQIERGSNMLGYYMFTIVLNYVKK